MTIASDPIVVIASSGELLTVLCARLTMAGETPITAASSDDPRLDATLRAKAVLIIDKPGLSGSPADAVAALRAQGWKGKLLLVLDALPDYPAPDGVAWIGGRRGAAVVVKALAELRG